MQAGETGDGQTGRKVRVDGRGVVVSNKQQKFRLYIDETEQDENFYLFGILIAEHEIPKLIKEINTLRKRIKKVMLADPHYALAKKHEDFIGLNLPEIHAVRLYQSTGYYKQNNPKDSLYWKKHRIWLEKMLQILNHSQFRIILAVYPDYKKAIKERLEVGSVAAMVNRFGFGQFNFTKSQIVEANPYAFIFPILLAAADQLLAKEGAIATVHCDDYEQYRGFEVLKCFEDFNKIGLYRNLSPPKFHDSASDPLVQAADVIAYVEGIIGSYGFNPDIKRKTDLVEWHAKYMRHRSIDSEHNALYSAMNTMMYQEVVFLASASDAKAKHFAGSFGMAARKMYERRNFNLEDADISESDTLLFLNDLVTEVRTVYPEFSADQMYKSASLEAPPSDEEVTLLPRPVSIFQKNYFPLTGLERK